MGLSVMTNKEALTALQEINVDTVSLVNQVDLIFESEDHLNKHLSLSEVMDVILSFRGSNTATVKDVNDLRKWLDGHIHRQLNRQMTETQGQLNRQMAETKRMFRSLMELDWCRSNEDTVPSICEPFAILSGDNPVLCSSF